MYYYTYYYYNYTLVYDKKNNVPKQQELPMKMIIQSIESIEDEQLFEREKIPSSLLRV
jgi:hypothetical protein